MRAVTYELAVTIMYKVKTGRKGNFLPVFCIIKRPKQIGMIKTYEF